MVKGMVIGQMECFDHTPGLYYLPFSRDFRRFTTDTFLLHLKTKVLEYFSIDSGFEYSTERVLVHPSVTVSSQGQKIKNQVSRKVLENDGISRVDFVRS